MAETKEKLGLWEAGAQLRQQVETPHCTLTELVTFLRKKTNATATIDEAREFGMSRAMFDSFRHGEEIITVKDNTVSLSEKVLAASEIPLRYNPEFAKAIAAAAESGDQLRGTISYAKGSEPGPFGLEYDQSKIPEFKSMNEAAKYFKENPHLLDDIHVVPVTAQPAAHSAAQPKPPTFTAQNATQSKAPPKTLAGILSLLELQEKTEFTLAELKEFGISADRLHRWRLRGNSILRAVDGDNTLKLDLEHAHRRLRSQIEYPGKGVWKLHQKQFIPAPGFEAQAEAFFTSEYHAMAKRENLAVRKLVYCPKTFAYRSEFYPYQINEIKIGNETTAHVYIAAATQTKTQCYALAEQKAGAGFWLSQDYHLQIAEIAETPTAKNIGENLMRAITANGEPGYVLAVSEQNSKSKPLVQGKSEKLGTRPHAFDEKSRTLMLSDELSKADVNHLMKQYSLKKIASVTLRVGFGRVLPAIGIALSTANIVHAAEGEKVKVAATEGALHTGGIVGSTAAVVGAAALGFTPVGWTALGVALAGGVIGSEAAAHRMRPETIAPAMHHNHMPQFKPIAYDRTMQRGDDGWDSNPNSLGTLQRNSERNKTTDRYIYVITADGKFKLGDAVYHTGRERDHAVFTLGADVIAAGEIVFINGKCIVNNKSENYQTRGPQIAPFVLEKLSRVCNVENAEFHYESGTQYLERGDKLPSNCVLPKALPSGTPQDRLFQKAPESTVSGAAHAASTSSHSTEKNITNRLSPALLEIACGAVHGAYDGVIGTLKTIAHPLDTVLYPLSRLAYYSTMRLGYEIARDHDDPEFRNMMPEFQAVLPEADEYFKECSAQLKFMKEHFEKADLREKTRMLSEFATGVYLNGKIISKVYIIHTALKNKKYFGTYHAAPSYTLTRDYVDNFARHAVNVTPPPIKLLTIEDLRACTQEQSYFCMYTNVAGKPKLLLATEKQEAAHLTRYTKPDNNPVFVPNHFISHRDLAGGTHPYFAGSVRTIGDRIIRNVMPDEIPMQFRRGTIANNVRFPGGISNASPYETAGPHIRGLMEKALEDFGLQNVRGSFRESYPANRAYRAANVTRPEFLTRPPISLNQLALAAITRQSSIAHDISGTTQQRSHSYARRIENLNATTQSQFESQRQHFARMGMPEPQLKELKNNTQAEWHRSLEVGTGTWVEWMINEAGEYVSLRLPIARAEASTKPVIARRSHSQQQSQRSAYHLQRQFLDEVNVPARATVTSNVQTRAILTTTQAAAQNHHITSTNAITAHLNAMQVNELRPSVLDANKALRERSQFHEAQVAQFQAQRSVEIISTGGEIFSLASRVCRYAGNNDTAQFLSSTFSLFSGFCTFILSGSPLGLIMPFISFFLSNRAAEAARRFAEMMAAASKSLGNLHQDVIDELHAFQVLIQKEIRFTGALVAEVLAEQNKCHRLNDCVFNELAILENTMGKHFENMNAYLHVLKTRNLKTICDNFHSYLNEPYGVQPSLKQIQKELHDLEFWIMSRLHHPEMNGVSYLNATPDEAIAILSQQTHPLISMPSFVASRVYLALGENIPPPVLSLPPMPLYFSTIELFCKVLEKHPEFLSKNKAEAVFAHILDTLTTYGELISFIKTNEMKIRQSQLSSVEKEIILKPLANILVYETAVDEMKKMVADYQKRLQFLTDPVQQLEVFTRNFFPKNSEPESQDTFWKVTSQTEKSISCIIACSEFYDSDHRREFINKKLASIKIRAIKTTINNKDFLQVTLDTTVLPHIMPAHSPSFFKPVNPALLTAAASAASFIQPRGT